MRARGNHWQSIDFPDDPLSGLCVMFILGILGIAFPFLIFGLLFFFNFRGFKFVLVGGILDCLNFASMLAAVGFKLVKLARRLCDAFFGVRKIGRLFARMVLSA